MAALIGFVGLAVDVGMWYQNKRDLQNAADSAVVAAAINGSGAYQSEAKAVAARYGFVDGAGGITVTALSNQTCPDTSGDCYTVTITEASAPAYFSAVLGIPGPTLASSAIAGGIVEHSYCVLALASSGTNPAILANGAPFANLSGCNIMSNTGMDCHGHNLNAPIGDAVGTDSGCGITQNSNMAAVADPYAYLASSIPANTCGSYPQEPSVSITTWAPGAKTLGATTIVCGDLKLSGTGGATTTLTTASPGSVLVIENGQLDTNGNTLQTAAGSALTIIFSGTAGSYTHAATGSGTLTFNWLRHRGNPGPALHSYQDPALTTGVNVSGGPTWDITGLVYLPHASVTFSGTENSSTNGGSCFGLVVDNLTINGTGSILDTGGCPAAGLTLPSSNSGAISLLQ